MQYAIEFRIWLISSQSLITGMSDSGSHGGSSPAETDITFTFVMEGCQPSADKSLQIDLAPTLSVLMGISIPSNSLGSLLTGVLPLFKPRERLDATLSNAFGVAKKFESSKKANAEESLHFQDYQRSLKLYQDLLAGLNKESEDSITRLFLKATGGMSAHLIESLATFDLYLMVVAIIVSLQVIKEIAFIYSDTYASILTTTTVSDSFYIRCRMWHFKEM